MIRLQTGSRLPLWRSLNRQPEVDLRRHGHHLENRYEVITPPWVDRFGELWYADANFHADDDE